MKCPKCGADLGNRNKCEYCGYELTVNAARAQGKKRRTWLWVLGWIFIFPVPLTLLVLHKEDIRPVLKYSIILLAWMFYVVFVFIGNGRTDDAVISQLKLITCIA